MDEEAVEAGLLAEQSPELSAVCRNFRIYF